MNLTYIIATLNKPSRSGVIIEDNEHTREEFKKLIGTTLNKMKCVDIKFEDNLVLGEYEVIN